jgi:rod shape-determining protein MreD
VSLPDVAKAGAIVFLVAIMQVTIFNSIDIMGGTPDVLLVTLLCVALLRGSIAGAVAGFWAGLIVDTANLVTLGVSSLLLTIAGYWIGRYGETTGRDRAHAPYLSVGVVTVLYAIGALIVHYMLGDPVVGRTVLLDSLPPSLLLNLLLTAPVYAVVRRLLPPASTLERTTEVSLLG